jgi:hypothetical protein
MDQVIVEVSSLSDSEARAAEVRVLDSMSEDGLPDAIVRSKVRLEWLGVAVLGGCTAALLLVSCLCRVC